MRNFRAFAKYRLTAKSVLSIVREIDIAPSSPEMLGILEKNGSLISIAGIWLDLFTSMSLE